MKMKGLIVSDVAGLSLTEVEKERLSHPLFGMVILFTRNFENGEQLKELCREIHSVNSNLLIGVDHEGGRVQRFRAGFTEIPAMHRFGALYVSNRAKAKRAIRAATFVMASELRECGVDFTFAPVFDLDWGKSAIIGERSFSLDPEAVADLAQSACEGLADAGMANCAKHFPGHGFAVADSHVSLPVDERKAQEILTKDVAPYRTLAKTLTSAMTAHVLYPALDSEPASFSHKIATEILREDVGFEGLLFSDDLSMGGAKSAGSILERAKKAIAAGCDSLIVCNDVSSTDELLEHLTWKASPLFQKRASGIRPKATHFPWETIRTTQQYAKALEILRVAV